MNKLLNVEIGENVDDKISTNADVEELMFGLVQKHRPSPRGEGKRVRRNTDNKKIK